MTANTISMSARIISIIIAAAAATPDDVLAGAKIFRMADPVTGRLTDLTSDERKVLREFVREATGHAFHHSNIPHRLARVGRAARALAG